MSKIRLLFCVTVVAVSLFYVGVASVLVVTGQWDAPETNSVPSP